MKQKGGRMTASETSTTGDLAAAFPGLAGGTVLVTGAGGGIGGGYVRAFTAAGANVVAVDLPAAAEPARRAVADAALAGPGQAAFVPGDITSDRDWESAVTRAMSAFGRIDALVNNAAVYQALATK